MDNALTDRRAFFDRLAPKRLRDERRHAEYYRDRLHWLSHLIREDASVVEIGCGTAPTLSALHHAKKTGIDFSSEMIRLASARDERTQYIQDDVETLKHHETYDYVLFLDSINYLNDVQSALRNVRANLCHERTRLVITYYNFLWQPLFLLAGLVRWRTKFPEQNWLSRSDIENLLTITGFEVVQTGERLLFPVWIPFISKFFNRYLARLPLIRRLCMSKHVIARPMEFGRKGYSVTVLSAVRNEKGNIERIAAAIPAMGTHTEVLFAEGHSTDGTWEEIQRVSMKDWGGVTVRGIQQTGTGKADALHCGARASQGELIMIYDGDFTVHPSELPMLYDVLASGRAEFINGSRLVYPMQKGAMRLLNLIGNRVFSLMFSWLFAQKLVDTLSPVKAFFRSDYTRMHSRMDPFGDFDFFLGAAMQQLKIREVPLHYLPRTYGTTKIRRFRHGFLLFTMFLHGAKKLKWI